MARRPSTTSRSSPCSRSSSPPRWRRRRSARPGSSTRSPGSFATRCASSAAARVRSGVPSRARWQRRASSATSRSRSSCCATTTTRSCCARTCPTAPSALRSRPPTVAGWRPGSGPARVATVQGRDIGASDEARIAAQLTYGSGKVYVARDKREADALMEAIERGARAVQAERGLPRGRRPGDRQRRPRWAGSERGAEGRRRHGDRLQARSRQRRADDRAQRGPQRLGRDQHRSRRRTGAIHRRHRDVRPDARPPAPPDGAVRRRDGHARRWRVAAARPCRAPCARRRRILRRPEGAPLGGQRAPGPARPARGGGVGAVPRRPGQRRRDRCARRRDPRPRRPRRAHLRHRPAPPAAPAPGSRGASVLARRVRAHRRAQSS